MAVVFFGSCSLEVDDRENLVCFEEQLCKSGILRASGQLTFWVGVDILKLREGLDVTARRAGTLYSSSNEIQKFSKDFT